MQKPRTMITFKKDGIKFTYRVGGIAFHNGRVLFQRADEDPAAPFWFLPGGRAELGESTEETLRREMLEELGVTVEIERLVFFMENLYEDPDKQETPFRHEIGLYFLITFPPDSYLYREDGPFERTDEIGSRVVFEWLPLHHLATLAVWPKFFRTALPNIPSQITHVIYNRD